VAVNADPAERLSSTVDDEGDAKAVAQQRSPSLRRPLALGAIILIALGGLFAWLGYRTIETRQGEHQRDLFLQVGRQAALDLTTISAANADTDVARILDSSTGTFHDDWAQRAPSFVEVVKKAQSKSEGSVTAAGLESLESDRARVLVAVAVKTSTVDAPEQKPRAWRMRIDVQKVGDDTKVANVEFVP
jgi:Mce-associated membrane protein